MLASAGSDTEGILNSISQSFLQGFVPLDAAGPGAPVSTRRPAPTHRAVHRPPTPRSEAPDGESQRYK